MQVRQLDDTFLASAQHVRRVTKHSQAGFPLAHIAGTSQTYLLQKDIMMSWICRKIRILSVWI